MIKLENIECKIDKNKSIFKNISFSIKTKSRCLIIGESGVGKTTLLKIIAGLISPDNGIAMVDGVNTALLSEQKGKIGMVFQNNALFDNLTVGENIVFPLKTLFKKNDLEAHAIGIKLMSKLNLGDIWDKKIKVLSGGMQKRVAIARTLAQEPRCLLLDEPFQGLDPISSQKILDLLYEVAKESSPTMIIVSNEIKYVLAFVNNVGILEQDRFIFFDTRENFINSRDTNIKRYLKLVGGVLS